MTVSNVGRFVDWEGCFNARDLGGLGALRPGALIRADSLDGLTARGWTTLSGQGVRTVIDLRNDGEAEVDHSPRPAGLTTLSIPLDGIEHRDFWDVWWGTPGFGTPAYFRPFLERFPDRVAAVARAVTAAPPGGVVFHCGLGRDRTGIIALALETARWLDAGAYLRGAGLTAVELEGLRGRLGA
ncbi:tyrosine-protein phosphatase [Streptomyces sp. WAC07061]|uniref:tyrosine-protein phosphatase n=1 Tax=Streptomyces sp. WAC07061 TaxID=2487410 RepID=UPI0021AE7E1C|nr:tyrosine-protein phosphatase [Streptomyces sp. WAC07061]